MTGLLWAVPIAPLAIEHRYKNTQTPHVTLAYGAEKEAYQHLIGAKITAIAISQRWNAEIEAIEVALPKLSLVVPNPHVTLSWVDGSAPVRAIELFKDAEGASREELDFSLDCRIKWIEWGDRSPSARRWKGRAYSQCSHVWRTGALAGQQCDKRTRSMSGRCRKHRN